MDPIKVKVTRYSDDYIHITPGIILSISHIRYELIKDKCEYCSLHSLKRPSCKEIKEGLKETFGYDVRKVCNSGNVIIYRISNLYNVKESVNRILKSFLCNNEMCTFYNPDNPCNGFNKCKLFDINSIINSPNLTEMDKFILTYNKNEDL